MANKPLIILDRDGVINQDSDAYIRSLEEWIPIPGSIDAIARLSKAGYVLAVATNQSGIGRGYYSLETLQAMHQRLNDLVGAAGGNIACIRYCPHAPEENCNCRKPKPGLIQQIGETLQAELSGAYIVGDSLRDLEAGLAVNCVPILVRTGKGEKTVAKLSQLSSPVLVFDDLAQFADHLLAG